MIRTRTVSMLLACALGASLLAAGCSGGGGSKPDKAAFCRDNATLNTQSAKAKSLADVAKIFKANEATIDDFQKHAPADIRTDANTLVNAAHKVISTGSTKAFSVTATAAAGTRVDNYCAKSSGATTTTTT
jgi:hypothetical protein